MALLEVWGKNLGICSAEVGFDLPAVQILNQRPLILLNRKLLSNPAGQVAKVEPLCFIMAALSRDQPSMEVDATFKSLDSFYYFFFFTNSVRVPATLISEL